MQPHIQNTEFGFITVDGEEIDHDILIRLSGKVKKRKKKLSKKEKGDSHTVSFAEAEHILDEGAERLIIGSGQNGNVRLSEEAAGSSETRAAPSNYTRRPTQLRSGTRPKAKPSPCSM